MRRAHGDIRRMCLRARRVLVSTLCLCVSLYTAVLVLCPLLSGLNETIRDDKY